MFDDDPRPEITVHSEVDFYRNNNQFSETLHKMYTVVCHAIVVLDHHSSIICSFGNDVVHY